MSDLLDALGYVGDALAKPGRAVRGVLSGNLNEGMAAIPFSDSMGLTDQSNAVSGTQLLDKMGLNPGGTLGDIAGFGAEVATDPLTWLGAGLGSRLGRSASEAAIARGPQFGTSVDDLAQMVARSGQGIETTADRSPMAFRALDTLRADPAAARLASEVNPASQFLGAGAEGLAFKTPLGDVTRLGMVAPEASAARPISEAVLNPTRAVSTPGWSAEQLPFAQNVGDTKHWRGRGPDMRSRMDMLDQALGQDQLKLADRHMWNVGDVGGKPMVIDPGALDTSKFTGQFNPVTPARDPGMMMSALLDALGSSHSLQQGVNPQYQALLSILGGGAGANAGAFGRASGQ